MKERLISVKDADNGNSKNKKKRGTIPTLFFIFRCLKFLSK